MLTILLVVGATAACVAALRPRRDRAALPKAGGPPEDRGEAVRRVLKHLQRKTIAEVEEGTAAVIVGTVHEIPGIEPLVSPLTNASCLGYHLEIRSAVFDEFMRLRQLRDEARCTAFEVRDETGAIRVDPQGLELAITDTPAILRHPQHPPEIRQRIPGWAYHLPITVEIGQLRPGMRVLVCGVAARELAPTDYRDGVPALLLRASATFPLVASTDADLFQPGERPIAPEELHRARSSS
ncbi:MAG TPA: hypothetical protein VL326_12210 [Kofleriaceae bacterium]|nr:hypothetical protein [Kofleriaceae bacterium]